MPFSIFVGYPPDRPSPRVAELSVTDVAGNEFFAEVCEENGEVLISVFGGQDDSPWTYPMEGFRAALERATVVATTAPEKA